MTADIINLRRARKQRARAADKADAAANAARHGVGKAERALADAEAERLRRTLDGAR
ncbi:MAG: DUF4169 domain-containing protein, partial [Rhodobacterales bacterium CG18_big_fil_WC_8_21_14_2_50_71_9]